MIYRDFKNLKLSTLGLGGMRFPTNKEGDAVDLAETEKMFDYAYNNGVNMFDTAFFYHGGESEPICGKLLSKYPRDTWYLSNKLPGNMIDVVDGKLSIDVAWAGMKNIVFDSPKDIFEYQLKNCGVDYFDFYMLHNVSESTFDLYTDEKIGMVDLLIKEKEAGRIKHIGFSTHGRAETIDKFLNMYDCFEFVLLQINYLDWTLQEAGKKYDVLKKHNMPIFVMEPLRGGKLATPGKDAEALLEKAKPGKTPVSWAFQYFQSLSNIYVTVSGMSTLDQLKENIEIFSKHDPLTDADIKVLQDVVDGMTSFVPCTSCRYCCDICPKKLDIPLLISAYNEASNEYGWFVEDILDALGKEKGPGACIHCNACTPKCPQDIDISETLSAFEELMKSKAE